MVGFAGLTDNLNLEQAIQLVPIPPDVSTRQILRITGLGGAVPSFGYTIDGYYARKEDGDFELISGGGSGSSLLIEDNLFTLSADGLTATGGVLTNPGPNPTLTITTIKQLKLWQGLVVTNVAADVFSDGKDDMVIANCVFSGAGGIAGRQVNSSIYVVNAIITGISGWSGLITNITPTSYSITFTQVGPGVPLFGQVHALTS